jgi:O-acetyl-ADP-ribose deacetylase (regulator of RNase III)
VIEVSGVAKLRVVIGDITRLQVDAIVNAANEALAGGGGVDGAIHDAAGPELLSACLALPEVRPGVRCPTGEARITPGFRLPARFVLHTAGPVWRGGKRGEPELLASCYRRCIELARAHRLATLAFPAISTGIYGYPLEAACAVAVEALSTELALSGRGSREPSSRELEADVERVVLVAFDKRAAAALRSALAAATSATSRASH